MNDAATIPSLRARTPGSKKAKKKIPGEQEINKANTVSTFFLRNLIQKNTNKTLNITTTIGTRIRISIPNPEKTYRISPSSPGGCPYQAIKHINI